MPHRTSATLAGDSRPRPNFRRFRALAEGVGCKALDHGEGFWTVASRSLSVAYWPASGDAYVANVAAPWHSTTPEGAIELASSPPRRVLAKSPWGPQKARKRLGLGEIRERVIARALDPGSGLACCHWCGTCIDPRDVTLDHVVPRRLGGVNSVENLVAACRWCNIDRGSDMPELDPRWRPKGPPSADAAWLLRCKRVALAMLRVPSRRQVRRLRRNPSPCLLRILAMVEAASSLADGEAR